MSERQAPHYHSRVKTTTNKSTFLSSEKQVTGKAIASPKTATDSPAVINLNRQQRLVKSTQRQSQDNTNTVQYRNTIPLDEINIPIGDLQYSSQPKPASHQYKNNSNGASRKIGKNPYSAASPKPPQILSAAGSHRVVHQRKTSPGLSSSLSPEPIPPPPITTGAEAPVLQGAWAARSKVESASSRKPESSHKFPSPEASTSYSRNLESVKAIDIQSKNLSATSKEYLDSANINHKSGTKVSSVNSTSNRKGSAKTMPAPTSSGTRPGASSSIGDRSVSVQDRNSPTGTGNSSSSNTGRSGSNSINGPMSSVVGSPSGSLASVNGLERCQIGATVKCVLLQPSGAAANGLNGSTGGGSPNHPRRTIFEGEVLAFEPRTKVLVLKCPSKCGKPSFHNLHLINSSLLLDVKIIKDSFKVIARPSLNGDRLENRLREQVERKKKQVMAFKAGVSPVGQRLFQAICKTIDDVTWSGENIYVLKEVTIYPPYKPENVKGNMDSKALKHVRKIVEKHISDQSTTSSPLAGQSPGAPSLHSTPSSSMQTARGSISTSGSATANSAARAASPAMPTSSQQSSAHGALSTSNRETSKSSSSATPNTLPNQPSNKSSSREGSRRGNSSTNSPNTHIMPGSSASERGQGGASGPQSARNNHPHYQSIKSSSYNQ